MYLDVIYEYEPTSVPYEKVDTDFAISYLAPDHEFLPNSDDILQLGCTEFCESPDYWYTMDAQQCQATLLILKKDWVINFIEMKCTCMIIYLAHLSESKTEIKLCLLNK